MSLATMDEAATDLDHGDRYCGRPKRQGDRGPCRKPAGHGTDHVGDGPCKDHGGALLQVRKAAKARLAQRQARQYLHEVKVVPVGDPVEALATLAAKVSAMMDFVADKVGQIDVDDWEGKTDSDSLQLSAHVALLRDLQDSLGRHLTSLAKLNLDERLVRIDEAKAALCIAAIEAAVAVLDLEPVDLERFMRTVAHEFDKRAR